MRILIHIPIGILISIPIIGWQLCPLFLAYERNEDRHLKDQAWKDIKGAITGFIIGELAQMGLIIWLVSIYA